MGESTGIAWTHHTFNPWWGCVKVSEACRDCYAEKWAERTGLKVWGQHAPRRFFGTKHWAEPLKKWNLEAEQVGERRRVFCASMADVFEQLPEDHPQREEMQDARGRLWALISSTPCLDWLLLTKRPENVRRMVPATWLHLLRQDYDVDGEPIGPLELAWPRNAWIGFTAENQERFDERWAHAQSIPAPVIFVSVEPQLGPVRPPETGPAPDWFIQGGESGARGRVRPFHLGWHHELLGWCRRRGRAYFLKQMGTELAWMMGLEDRKGEEPSEWPEEYRIQEFPTPRGV